MKSLSKSLSKPVLLALLALLILENWRPAEADLNQSLDQQEQTDLQKRIQCMKNGEKINYADNYMLDDGLVYKAIYCEGEGYSGFEKVARLDEIQTTPCDWGGNFQQQWTLREDQGVEKLTLIRKWNSCMSEGTPKNYTEAILNLAPVKWVCVKDSVFDPQNLGLDCSFQEQ